MQEPLLYSPKGHSSKKFVFMFLTICAVLCLACNALAINGTAVSFFIPLPDRWETVDKSFLIMPPDNWETVDKKFFIAPPESSMDSGFIIQGRQDSDKTVIVPITPSDNASSDTAGDVYVVPFTRQSNGDFNDVPSS